MAATIDWKKWMKANDIWLPESKEEMEIAAAVYRRKMEAREKRLKRDLEALHNAFQRYCERAEHA